MPIKNTYNPGFNTKITTPRVNRDNSDWETENRDLGKLNTSNPSKIKNTYLTTDNRFGAASRYARSEQQLVSSLVEETININGITTRFMPRGGVNDDMWNERPESRFDRGFKVDMFIESAAGFEGEGDIIGNFGIEFREEVILRVSIDKFQRLLDTYSPTDDTYKRKKPLEGDIIVIPFGISGSEDNYSPKFFEIIRVTEYQDVQFFALGDNYQHRLHCRLFEVSGEDFAAGIVRVEEKNVITGELEVLIDSEIGPIHDSTVGIDSENWGKFDKRFEDNYFADNKAIEEQALEDQNDVPSLTHDYTARAFGFKGVINLDDI